MPRRALSSGQEEDSVQATHETALIVGASRGLGLGWVRAYLDRGWHVVATTRGRNDAELKRLAETAVGRLKIEPLDVTDASALDRVRRTLAETRLDLLFVSAGIANGPNDRFADVSEEEFGRIMSTNALAPMRIIETLDSLVVPNGVVVAMTSSLGSVSMNTSGDWEVYRASKAALNTMLRSYAARHQHRSVVAMHPGWVRTDMGGANASIGVEQSVAGMVDAIGSRRGMPGCVYLDYEGRTIAW